MNLEEDTMKYDVKIDSRLFETYPESVEVVLHIKPLEEIREGIEFHQRHFYEEFVVTMIYIISIL